MRISTARTYLSDVATIYNRLKRFVAYALVIIVLFPRLIPVPGIQLGAILALAVIILETLLDIQKYVTSNTPSRVYPDFYSTSVAIQSTITQKLERNDVVRISALGMSMGHAWPLLLSITTPLLAEKSKARVNLTISMLDGSWVGLNAINPDWAHRARNNFEEISRFIEINERKFKDKGWVVALHTYHYMPNWHGVLLDDDHLFLSTCFWQNGKLTGAENLYEHFVAGERELSDQRISEFSSWFDYTKTLDS